MIKRITLARIDFNEYSYSGRISNHQMTCEPITSRFDVRSALVIAALVSLCVSNNVGPCFLPLPVVTERVAENRHKNQHNTASRPPSPAQSDSFRVPMMAQQKRADNEHYPQPLAATLKAGFVPEDARAAAEFSYPISLLTSLSVSQPPGRAPPRLS
ncbi:MAG: hypothetical protein ABR568_10890 [Pyrinomonadaceae bacterium]